MFLCFAGPYKSHSEKVLLLSKSSYLFPDINQTNKAFIDDVIVKIHYIFTHVLFNHRIKYRVLITIFDITEHKCCPISTLKYINKNQNSNIFLSIIIYFLFCKPMKDFGSFTKPSDDTLVLLETN